MNKHDWINLTIIIFGVLILALGFTLLLFVIYWISKGLIGYEWVVPEFVWSIIFVVSYIIILYDLLMVTNGGYKK